MIVVDSGVWLDYFAGRKTQEVVVLDGVLGKHPVGTSALIYAEVLQKFMDDKDFDTAKKMFSFLSEVQMVTPAIALKSADNARSLKSIGIPVVDINDVIIATYCIETDVPLLYANKNFIHFENHFGLKNVLRMMRKAS